MKVVALIAVSAALVMSSSAFAQGLTRAEVRQQLVEAQQNGSRYVTDASYPDVSPIYQGQVAQQKDAEHAYGGTSASGAAGTRRAGTSTFSGGAGATAAGACVGPVSFCNIYSGS